MVIGVSVWTGLGITILLGESEVNDVNLVTVPANAHQEIVGLDIMVNELMRVYVLNTGNLTHWSACVSM